MNARSRYVALIPARGGGKRLPRKNVLPLAGKPLLGWTIEAAESARYIDRIVLSTDDDEIAAIGRQYGAEVPFMRPKEHAADTTATADVVLHAVQTLRASGDDCDYIVILQPTSPLRSPGDIDAAIDLLRAKNADAVISVCRTDHPPAWTNTLPDDLSMRAFYRPGVRSIRSQDLPKTYRLNGAIYVYSCRRILETGSLVMDDNAYAYIMPRERSVDIDSAADFEVAQLFMQRFQTQASA